MSAFVRAGYVLEGVLLWSAPSFLVAPVAEWLWPYVAVPLATYGVYRGMAVKVRESADGLVVRNVVLAFEVAWSDVLAVGWYDIDGSQAMPKGYVAPWLEVRGRRRRVPVLAMASWMRPSRENARTVRGWAQKVT